MKKRAGTVGLLAAKERRPQAWTTEQQLVTLHETHSLTDEALHTWCRKTACLPSLSEFLCERSHTMLISFNKKDSYDDTRPIHPGQTT